MKTIKAYQRAVSIITNKHDMLDFETIVYKLAEYNPTEFLKIYDAIVAEKSIIKLSEVSDDSSKIMLEAFSIARTEGQVPCIKFLRQKFNLGLKEAKELSDAKIKPFI